MSLASVDANAFCESSPSGIARSRAKAAAGHEGLLVATATTSNPLSTRLRRLVPSPETHTPSLILAGWSGVDHPIRPCPLDDLAGDERIARHVFAVDDQDHAKAHVESSPHLIVGDAAANADLVED